jgi:hypothetical protein
MLFFKHFQCQRPVRVVGYGVTHDHEAPGMLAQVFALIPDEDNVVPEGEIFMTMFCGIVSRANF